MAKAIHSMIRVLNEERSLDFYERAFGLKVSHRLDFSAFALVYLRGNDGPFELELTINKDREGPYNLGDGHGHIAFVVDDLDSEHARFEAEGLNPRKIVEFAPDGDLIAKFFFVQDPDGYEIEVLQRAGHYQ
ncbi:VOC family protein [Ruegeria lacuscaerulensis]|uniref:VOC family protein n=1 Tax=Ruegeria lacuscaerulensis TaxID=55218 RepID=UPI00147DC810|nr:VOC family protein [Ruegeria lacuscaerulensis]